MPAPRFAGLVTSWSYLAGAYTFESPKGIDEYLRVNGTAGWRAGLTDDRPATATARIDPARTTDVTPRVKDVFCIHY